MSKEWDKFVKDFKATKRRIKQLGPAEGKKIKKKITTFLNETWSKEDKVTEAIEKAVKSGETGTKAADFMKDSAFSKSLAEWKKSVLQHHKNIAELTMFSDEAQTLHDVLAKRCEEIEKDMKKNKTSMADVKVVATVKEAKRCLPDLKKSGGMGSSLQGHVVFYARKLPQSVEAIVKAAVKKNAPKEFPKTLQEAQRKRTLRGVQGNERKLLGLCKSANSLIEKDVKKAQKVLKMAKSELSEIVKLHDQCTDVSKKMKKELDASKDKAEIVKLMKNVEAIFKKCDAAFDKADEEVEKAMANI